MPSVSATFHPPASDIEEVKDLGAIPMADGSWGIPRSIPRTKFAKWLEVQSTRRTRVVSLRDFLGDAASILKSDGPPPMEVSCEIEEAYLSGSGHAHLRLRDGDASCRALIWRGSVDEVFGAAGLPAQGQMGMATVALELSVAWGLRLVMSSWRALGQGVEYEKRMALQGMLRDSGLIAARASMHLPRALGDVAVLAPDGAGLEDMEASVKLLEEAGLLRLQRRLCTFEGPSAAVSLQEALQWACGTEAQAVLMVRGGGAPSSLSWLDDERVLLAAGTLPMPLITGLGHERDHPLLELLATRVEGTPSKAALFVVHACTAPLRAAVRQFEQMATRGADMAAHARKSADEAMHRTTAASPATVLARGYATVRDAAGELVTAPTTGRLHITLAGGTMDVTA